MRRLKVVVCLLLVLILVLQNVFVAGSAYASCFTNTEFFTNTGFETDLSGWSAGPSFDDSTFNDTSGAVAAWPLDDTTSTQSFSRVVNPAVATGRDIVLNGGFDTDTIWTKGTGWTIAGGVSHSDGTGVSTQLGQALPSRISSTYEVTYTIS